MRLIPLIMIVLLAACQSNKSETDHSVKLKTCDARAKDSGGCVPGEYEGEY